MKEFEEKVREHCNIEFNKANGDEMINTSLNSLMIAFEEWQSKSNRSVGYTVLLAEIENIEYNSSAEGCGLEDANIEDRYEAMEHGWNNAIQRVLEAIENSK